MNCLPKSWILAPLPTTCLAGELPNAFLNVHRLGLDIVAVLLEIV